MEKNKKTENKRKTMTKNSSARIKSRTPAAAAAAACAVIAFGGALWFADSSRGSTSPAASPEEAASAAELAVTEESSAAEQQNGDNETSATASDITRETNEELKRNEYARYDGVSYEIGSKNLRLFDERVGEITAGFEGLDMWVCGTAARYPYYEIMVAVRTKDGSPLADMLGESSLPDITTVYGTGLELNGYGASDLAANGDTGILYIHLDFSENGNYYQDGGSVTLRIDGINNQNGITTESSGSFTATIPVDDMKYNDRVISDINAEGSWDNKLKGENSFILDYELLSLSYSEGGLELLMDIKTPAEDWEYEAVLYSSARMTKRWSGREIFEECAADENSDMYGAEYDDDYDFIKLDYADGTVKGLDHGWANVTRQDDGSYRISFNTTFYGIDLEGLTAIEVGSVTVPV
ncbi:MAG: hypothetical protein IJ737_05230 [Ruminococcus sp.]|nr:hypothetical protein [Ruminococcus sp.]